MPEIYPLIMAGGVGSRFWPYSRESKPKQFLDILGTGKSLLQMTIERFDSICSPDHVFIATNSKYREMVREQCPEIPDNNILLEPARRNTAPCIAYGALKIGSHDPEGVMVVTPSDHVIFKEQEFASQIRSAVEKAASGQNLVTLGIKPTAPFTGYGYIKFDTSSGLPVKKALEFIEKPDENAARQFLDDGNYVWNAGIFIWSINTIQSAFEKYHRVTYDIFKKLEPVINTESEMELLQRAYPSCEDISIDYAIMEQAENVFVIPSDLGWSDLGSWVSFYDLKEKDENQNLVEANSLIYDATGCIVKSEGDKLIVIEGLKDYLVADHNNVLLICNKNNEKRLKEIVKQVKKNKGDRFI